jgi:hypothetical protein
MGTIKNRQIPEKTNKNKNSHPSLSPLSNDK